MSLHSLAILTLILIVVKQVAGSTYQSPKPKINWDGAGVYVGLVLELVVYVILAKILF